MHTNIRPEFFGPRDNFPLSTSDWTRICELCDTVSAVRCGRADYLRAHGLDARLHLPGHMWADDFVAKNFRKIARKDFHQISHLRFLTYNFTGFHLQTMAPAEGIPDTTEVPANIDAVVRAAVKKASEAAVVFVRDNQHMPRERIVDTPRLFGESGWDVDGTIANFDSWSTQQRLNGLHWSGVLDLLQQRVRERGFARIVEIGAGYGNLAHALRRIGGPVDYTIVDLPESMIYSTIWLSTVSPGARCTIAAAGQPLAAPSPGITFVPNHMLGEFLPQLGEVDLVVNMMSLSEMSPDQVAHYGRAAAQLIGSHGVFYEQNYLEPGVQTDILPILGRVFGYGAWLDETQSPHRGRGNVRMWANAYRGELWNRGGLRPLATRQAPAVLTPEPACLREPVPVG